MEEKISNKVRVVLYYIYDINSIGTSCSKVNHDRDTEKAALCETNIWTDPTKELNADSQHYKESIGFAWWKEGTLTVKPAHALRLFRVTDHIVSAKRSSQLEIRRVVGLWTYELHFRRPAFSILSNTFTFVDDAGSDTKHRVPDSVID